MGAVHGRRPLPCAHPGDVSPILPTDTPDAVFLHELSADQRRAFFVLARQVIDADRRLAIQEVERLDRLYLEAGVEAEHADAPSAVGDVNLLFHSERSRIVVLLDLLLVAYADGRLDPREREALRGVAARLQIDAGTWEGALDWARRYEALVEEAKAMGSESAVGMP